MKKLIRGINILCGLGILFFGSCLDSTEHFKEILIALIFCIVWLLLYGFFWQRGE